MFAYYKEDICGYMAITCRVRKTAGKWDRIKKSLKGGTGAK